MDARSPLTNKLVCSPVNTYKTSKIIEDWESTFNIDISNQFSGVPKIYRYKCPESGLFFFEPKVTGSHELYQHLSKFNWYYPIEKWEYSVTDSLLTSLEIPINLLEIGCGEGNFLELISPKVRSAYGIDINPQAVLAARTKGINVDCISIEQLSESCTSRFDAVVAFQVLEHLMDPFNFLLSVTRILRSGGFLVLATPNSESFLRYQYTLLDMPPHHVTQWNSSAYHYLQKILPLSLIGLYFESLSKQHTQHYALSTVKFLLSRLRIESIFLERILARSLHSILKLGLRRLITGQSMIAVFRKL